MSEIKIDGHVQWSGSGFKFFETLQPGLSCEDPVNHSSCKAQSAALAARLTEADLAERKKTADAAKAEVEKAAQEKAEQDKKDLANRAGVAKHDARRIAGLKMNQAKDAAMQKAQNAIAKAHAEHEKAVAAANTLLEAELADAQAARDEAEREIEAIDWIAEVSPKAKPADAAEGSDA